MTVTDDKTERTSIKVLFLVVNQSWVFHFLTTLDLHRVFAHSLNVLSRPFLLRRFLILTHTFEEWELHTFGRGGGGSYKLKFKVKHR